MVRSSKKPEQTYKAFGSAEFPWNLVKYHRDGYAYRKAKDKGCLAAAHQRVAAKQHDDDNQQSDERNDGYRSDKRMGQITMWHSNRISFDLQNYKKIVQAERSTKQKMLFCFVQPNLSRFGH